MYKKPAKTDFPINDLIAMRWSARAFDPDKPVERDKILSLCEAGRWTPSSGGDEPWRYIVWDKFHNEDEWNKAFECINPSNQVWVKNAPVIFATIADKMWRNDRLIPNRTSYYDTGASAMNIYLQAFHLGLYAHPIGGFDAEKLRITFKIPAEYEPIALIIIGYPGDMSVLDDYNQKREVAERKRQTLGSAFFDSIWGEPIIK